MWICAVLSTLSDEHGRWSAGIRGHVPSTFCQAIICVWPSLPISSWHSWLPLSKSYWRPCRTSVRVTPRIRCFHRERFDRKSVTAHWEAALACRWRGVMVTGVVNISTGLVYCNLVNSEVLPTERGDRTFAYTGAVLEGFCIALGHCKTFGTFALRSTYKKVGYASPRFSLWIRLYAEIVSIIYLSPFNYS